MNGYFDFAVANHIGFAPSVAFFNDFDRAIAYLQNASNEIDANDDLYLEHVKELCAHRPSNYLCPQSRVLVIDENLNVLTCCAPKDEDYGSILNYDTTAELNASRSKAEKCEICQLCKADFWFNTPVMFDMRSQSFWVNAK